MKVFSAKRLTVARERRGYTKKALAEAIGVSGPSVTSYENGDASPEEANVNRIALFLGFPRSFFFLDDSVDLEMEAVSFRSRRSMTAKFRDMTLASGRLAAATVSPAFHKRFEMPVEDVPDLTGHQPEVAARLLRNHWKLGVGPIRNMIHLLESKGVEIYWIDIEAPSVDAVSFWRDKKPFILMNLTKREAGDRARFDAAHELAHLVLHRRELVVDGRDIEAQADRFASSFLLPSDQFRVEIPRYPVLNQFFPLKERWGTSIQAMLRRGRDIGMYSEWQFEHTLKELSSNGWRTKEPVNYPREDSLLHETLYSRLSKKGIQPHKIATQIMLPAQDLYELTPTAVRYSQTTEENDSLNDDPRVEVPKRYGHLSLVSSDLPQSKLQTPTLNLD